MLRKYFKKVSLICIMIAFSVSLTKRWDLICCKKIAAKTLQPTNIRLISHNLYASLEKVFILKIYIKFELNTEFGVLNILQVYNFYNSTRDKRYIDIPFKKKNSVKTYQKFEFVL